MKHPKSKHVGTRMLIAVVAVGLVAAACGGSSKKKGTTAAGDTTTTEAVTGDSTTTTAVGETTTTAAAAVTGSGTATTVKSSSATTAKKASTVTTIKKVTPNTQPALANVVATTSTTAAGGPEVTPGGSVVMQVAADVKGFDPAVMTSSSTATDGPRGMAIFDVLFYQDSTTYDLVAQTVDSMKSTDGKVWQMKLKPNIKFSDGTAYDAEAVRFNWARLQDPANASPTRATANAMTEMKVVDPLTLQITLSGVNGQFPRVIANAFPFIGSPTALKDPAKFNTNPVGAGPFVLKDYVRDSQTVLERNPTYWNAPLPYLDRLTIKVVGDDSQRLNSLFANEAQITRVSRPQDVATAKGKGYGNAIAILNGGNDLILNNSKFPFNDKRMRQGLAAAIDLDAYNTSVEGGAGVPARTLFQSTSSLFQDIQLSKYDTAKAKSLFDAVAADCKCTIEFTISASLGKSSTAAEFMQAQMQQFKNVKVNVTQVTTVQLVSNSQQGTYDAQVWANLPIDPEPNLYISFRTGQTGNFNRYSNAQMDAALDTGRTSLDNNARIQAYKTVQQIMADDVPSFFYARTQQGFLTSPKVHDLKVFEDGTALVDRIWLSK